MSDEMKAEMDESSEKMLNIVLGDDEEEDDNNKENIPPCVNPIPKPIPKVKEPISLIDYLCQLYHCSEKELQVLFQTLETRREIVQHLRRNVQLRTTHLRPPVRNMIVRCCDITSQSAGNVLALGGYLGITVGVF
jgi:hypothetical protein